MTDWSSVVEVFFLFGAPLSMYLILAASRRISPTKIAWQEIVVLTIISYLVVGLIFVASSGVYT